MSHGNNVFVEFESGFGNDRGTGFEVQYSETDDPPTDVGDASTTVTTKPTDEQTDKPSDKPTFKQAEPPTSNYYFILIFMLYLMVQIRPSLQVHNHTLDIYLYIYICFQKCCNLKIYIKYIYIFHFLITKVHVCLTSEEQYLLFLI